MARGRKGFLRVWHDLPLSGNAETQSCPRERHTGIQSSGFPGGTPARWYATCRPAATARRQKVDYLLLWRVPADFVARYGKELGLCEGEAFPLLLRLDAWREGERELPEKIVLPAELGR